MNEGYIWFHFLTGLSDEFKKKRNEQESKEDGDYSESPCKEMEKIILEGSFQVQVCS